MTKIREQTEQCHKLESEYRVAESSISHAEELIAATKGSVVGTEKSIQAELESCKTHTAKIGELQKAEETLTQEREQLAKEQGALSEKASALEFAIAQALGDIRSLEDEAVDVKVRISVLENAKNNDTDKGNCY